MGFPRLGCVFCPMAKPTIKEMERKLYPGIEKAYKKAIQHLIDTKGYYDYLDKDADLVFEWWISNKSVKDFLKSRHIGPKHRKKDKSPDKSEL